MNYNRTPSPLTVHITMGLPGSGKTYWAHSHKKEQYYIIDLDELGDLTNYANQRMFISKFSYVASARAYCQNVIVDGLILTTESLCNVINLILDACTMTIKFQECFSKVNIIVHHWNENRKACLINDSHRMSSHIRTQDATETIKHAKYDVLLSGRKIQDTIFSKTNEKWSDFQEDYPKIPVEIETIEHIVKAMKPVDCVLSKYLQQDPETGKTVLKSPEWCTGGSWRDCYGSNGDVDPESPQEFNEFDGFLTELCPELSFVQYKKLYKECCTIKCESRSYDYYGGYASYQWHECDIDKLKSMLFDEGIISEI